MSEILGLRHAAVPVQNLQRALDFYCNSLGFHRYHTNDEDWAMVALGGTSISLVPMQEEIGITPRGGSHPAHLGITVRNPETVNRLYSQLSSLTTIRTSSPKQHRDGSYGFYFTDTEGNQLECIFIPYGVCPPASESKSTGTILLAHGSRNPQWKQPFEHLLDLAKMHASHLQWELAYMELAQPSLSEAVQQLMQQNSLHCICILPVFMATGEHLIKDIPAILEPLQEEYPKTQFKLFPALGESALVQEAFVTAAIEQIDNAKSTVFHLENLH